MTDISRREFLGGLGAIALSFAHWSDAYGAQVIDVRTWPAPEYTRVTIEHDAPMKFRYFVLRTSTPVRLAVDIDGLILTDKLRKTIEKVKPNDPYIARIRVGQNKPKVVRVTIDFKTDVDPQVFSLNPVGNYKYRLVFDIYPAEQKDPLMAIIQKEESEPDAIARLLEQVAEGQKRMEENREEFESDQIGALIAGISSGNLTPMKPEELPPVDKRKPTPAKPSKRAPQVAQKPKQEEKRTPKTTKRVQRTRLLVIAIDPGHGGEDPGAIGKKYRTREKDVVLSIAKVLYRQLNEIDGIKAVLTRQSDYFVPLQRRVSKARAAKADLLVSIHADAWIKPQAKGSSIYALNNRGKVSTSNRWLAKNQNNADLIGGVNIKKQNRQIARILMDMSMTAQVSDSMAYGGRILSELKKVNTLHKSRVQQANFAVLKAPDIPSVLVETAFLSNPDEERNLRTSSFQRKLACAIGNGILIAFNFKERMS